MSQSRTVPPDTRLSQAEASDPTVSAWVSANAGSGKTHVLAQRVVRLLLDGVEPSKILCLTYTKAAAANMSNRVFKDLARWTTLPDGKLAEEIAAIEGRQPDGSELIGARRLFAKALETPGGLKIQTIHAFCEAILHQFPLEANIAGHFEMLDGRMEAALLAEARRDMLTGIAADGDTALGAAFERVLSIGGEAGLDKLLGEIVAKRDPVRRLLDGIGPDFAALFAEFGLDPESTPAAILATAWPDPYFDVRLGRALAERAAAEGKAKAAAFAAALLAAHATTDPRGPLEALCKLFLTADRDTKEVKPRSAAPIMSKGVAEHFPGFHEAFARCASALAAASDQIALLNLLHATKAALTVADTLIGRYERLKAARGFLDFNDLITRTVRLLARTDVGPWVQYKLDRGIDHILVDEAQDTSPDQWEVVGRLAEEFFVGAGQRDNVNRTVFAVGDEKQSIYSFQGADPESFRVSGGQFRQRIDAASGRFRQVKLERSFRSTEDVLNAVDRVFAGVPARQGLTRDEEPIHHTTIRAAEPGLVEIWPLIEPTAVEEPDDWSHSIDHASAPAVQLAEQIATTVAAWLRDGEALEGKLVDGGPRRIRAGDVLVLVRKRDRFVHALNRTLKDKHVPVAGADRLSLPSHIAVKDLIALGRVCLQPHDDLSLATLLRSPIFGLSDPQLFDLAWKRGTRALSTALREKAAGDPALAAIVETLGRWTNEAAFKPVFDFYAGVLGRDGVRRRMIARLGPSAGEILDEFQNFALAAERTGLPGLEAFLATIEQAGPDIKREMDHLRDEVRIMTVHASKGLEAPIVFLVDSGSRPFHDSHLPRLVPFQPRSGLWQGSGYLWRASADVANGALRTINASIAVKAEEEYRRLLYVGMTRAEDRLVVCGYRGAQEPHQHIWHRLVTQAVAGAEATTSAPHPAGGTEILRFRTSPATDRVAGAAPPPAGAPIEHPPLPPLPQRAGPEPALSPSAAAAMLEPGTEVVAPSRSPVLDNRDEPSFAIARGLAIHRLLQVLPTLPEGERDAAAARYLEAAGQTWPDAERRRAADSVAAILRDARFAPVFSAASRAEVSISGRLEIGGVVSVVSGTIDRLAVEADEVIIVDYKTNRPPPRSAGEVPAAYVVQLALYRALLSRIYPDRTVRAALLFTETPNLIELPPEALDAALARLGRS